MNSILCPTDFSEAANNALEHAAKLAKKTSAKLTLLHVEYILAALEGDGLTEIESLSKKKEALYALMQTTCEEIQKRFSVKCNYDIETIDLEKAISKDTGNSRYDLLVAGTNGMDDLHQFYFGTNTWNMIKNSGCPVLVVPEGCAWKEPEKVVYATAYQKEDTIAIEQLADILSPFPIQIDMVHASKEETSISRNAFSAFCKLMKNKLGDDFSIRFHHIIDPDPALGLERYMYQSSSDWLALSTRQKSTFEMLFYHSLTKKISSFTTHPVLVFHY